MEMPGGCNRTNRWVRKSDCNLRKGGESLGSMKLKILDWRHTGRSKEGGTRGSRPLFKEVKELTIRLASSRAKNRHGSPSEAGQTLG